MSTHTGEHTTHTTHTAVGEIRHTQEAAKMLGVVVGRGEGEKSRAIVAQEGGEKGKKKRGKKRGRGRERERDGKPQEQKEERRNEVSACSR